MSSCLITDEKIKAPEKGANVLSSFFLSTAENLNLHQVGREYPIYFLKHSFPCKFHGIEMVPTSETEIKSIIFFLKLKNSSGDDEIKNKILKACASL
jgi:hypothetical protein